MIVHMIGNAHLDPVWLWNWPAGVDEALATFRSAADRCDEYPEFVYSRGEAWLYEQVEALDPALFSRVCSLVHNGQWHITGGQYIQPDANLPTTAGWHKQIEFGQRYFQKRFGVRPKVGYNVDTFGHPGTLPDLYAQHDYLGYVFHRPSPAQQPLPAQVFRWLGTGGGELLAFRIVPAYVTRSDDLYGQIRLALDAADQELGHTMCFYGVGNHGGGPTKANIEYILEHRHAFPDAELRFSTPEAFFDAIAPLRERLPVVKGELQRTFPGCYSVMHDIKQAQHRGEQQLEQAQRVLEAFGPEAVTVPGAIAGENSSAIMSEGSAKIEQVDTEQVDTEEASRAAAEAAESAEYDVKLARAWKDLLFTQFHDILAGTSVASAWPSVRAMQGRSRILAEEVITHASRRWARLSLPPVNEQQLVILNPDHEPYRGLLACEPFLDFDAWGDRWISGPDGQALPFQLVQPEGSILLCNRVLVPVQVPQRGHLQLTVRDDAAPGVSDFESDLAVTEQSLSNGHFQLALGAGGIEQLAFQGVPLLGTGGVGLQLRADSADTWGFQIDRFSEPVRETFGDVSNGGWMVEERGPLRAVVRLEGWLGHSRVLWRLELSHDDPALHIHLEINFSQRSQLLQLPLWLGREPSSWLSRQPGGQIDRRSGPVEWPVQSWSKVRLGDLDLALVTPDAYSLSLDEKCWRWTLLRSPKMAWGGGRPDVYGGHDQFTDQGVHAFHMVLRAGEHLDPAGLDRTARQLTQPPITFDRYEGMNRPPWKNDVPRRLWTGAEQRARQDGHMMHLKDSDQKGVEEDG